MAKRRIVVLGSTGSIGTQTLDVVRRHGDQLEIVGLAVNGSVDALLAQAREFYQRAADKGYQSAQEALQRLDSQADTAPGAYDYKPPQGQEKFREKPKKGGLFGFFKK